MTHVNTKNKKLLSALIALICVAAIIAGASAVYFTVFKNGERSNLDGSEEGNVTDDTLADTDKEVALQTVEGLDATNASNISAWEQIPIVSKELIAKGVSGGEGGEAAGFAHCALRGEYTEGVINLPAGYLEAVFVKEKYRRKGFARALVAAAEEWARAKGCTEFASDCECGNEDSVAFHKAAGFGEVNRIVCFVKKL